MNAIFVDSNPALHSNWHVLTLQTNTRNSLISKIYLDEMKQLWYRLNCNVQFRFENVLLVFRCNSRGFGIFSWKLLQRFLYTFVRNCYQNIAPKQYCPRLLSNLEFMKTIPSGLLSRSVAATAIVLRGLAGTILSESGWLYTIVNTVLLQSYKHMLLMAI